MCTSMYIDMSVDMCIDTGIDTCIDICIDISPSDQTVEGEVDREDDDDLETPKSLAFDDAEPVPKTCTWTCA